MVFKVCKVIRVFKVFRVFNDLKDSNDANEFRVSKALREIHWGNGLFRSRFNQVLRLSSPIFSMA